MMMVQQVVVVLLLLLGEDQPPRVMRPVRRWILMLRDVRKVPMWTSRADERRSRSLCPSRSDPHFFALLPPPLRAPRLQTHQLAALIV